MNMIGYRFAVTLIAGMLACFAALIFWTIVGIRRGWLDKKFRKFVAICIVVLIVVTAVSIAFTGRTLANSGLHSDWPGYTEVEEQAEMIDKE